MIQGFQLRSLRVRGTKKETAEVLFTGGLNVISGASNTGKSYILQCVDFVFGGSESPKEIAESTGYETIEIELQDDKGDLHRLERSLSGGGIKHTQLSGVAKQPEELAAKHLAKNKKSVSGFLLDLLGAWGLKILKNQHGTTRPLSFRDLAWLCLVDEVRIIGDRSPALSGQYTTGTEEVSVFRLLLTGTDDSGVVARESPKDRRTKQSAQLQLLDRWIAELVQQSADLDSDPSSVGERIKKVREAIDSRTSILGQKQEELAHLDNVRTQAWKHVHFYESRSLAVGELRGRFSLLERHYNSDLARLQAVVEFDHYFSQLQEVKCPLCGVISSDVPKTSDQELTLSFDEIRSACRAEMSKIRLLLIDLGQTVQQIDLELGDLSRLYRESSSAYDLSNAEIQERLAPVTQQTRVDLDSLMGEWDRLSQTLILQTKLEELRDERKQIAVAVPKEVSTSEKLSSSAIEEFSLVVQSLLEKWKYPGLSRVTFNAQKNDIVISGKNRGAEGKGFRAIGMAAFIVALMKYCGDSDISLPHPGLVILDSPLVTYKRRDTLPGEEIPEDVGVAFYEALADLPPTQQVIVLENNDPPDNLSSKINYIHFSRSTAGRYGFFPVLISSDDDGEVQFERCLRTHQLGSKYFIDEQTATELDKLLLGYRTAFNHSLKEAEGRFLTQSNTHPRLYFDFIDSSDPNALAIRCGEWFFIGFTKELLTSTASAIRKVVIEPQFRSWFELETAKNEEESIAFGTLLLRVANLFTLGHELGHHFYGHTVGSAFRVEFNAQHLESSLIEHASEIEADVYGAVFTMAQLAAHKASYFGSELLNIFKNREDELIRRVLLAAVCTFSLSSPQPDFNYSTITKLSHPPRLARMSYVGNLDVPVGGIASLEAPEINLVDLIEWMHSSDAISAFDLNTQIHSLDDEQWKKYFLDLQDARGELRRDYPGWSLVP